MPDLFFDRHVPHVPARMFELVNELERYPGFLPNVTGMKVFEEDGARYATMTVRFGPVTQSYTSKVEADEKAGTITATATDGPFKYLDSKWTFEREGEGTRVRFDIDFKIANPMLAAVAEPAFAAKQQEIMDAFLEEADRRFG